VVVIPSLHLLFCASSYAIQHHGHQPSRQFLNSSLPCMHAKPYFFLPPGAGAIDGSLREPEVLLPALHKDIVRGEVFIMYVAVCLLAMW